MSALWTPDGAGDERRATPDEDVADTATTDDEFAEASEMLAETRRRLAEMPAEVVVANHAMGLYELGAIHLSADPPNFTGARLAIDAYAALVDGLGDRLGPDASTLRQALQQIRMAYVEVQGRASAG